MKTITMLLVFVLLVSLIPVSAHTSDLSVQLAESQIKRENPMTHWRYYDGFYMYSLFKVYQRTKNPAYLDFMKQWAAINVPSIVDGKKTFKSLDDMYPGLALLYLYEKTGDEHYKKAASKIREALHTYPRTKDGGFFHSVDRDGQLWLDGMYMINVFLAKYGQLIGDQKSCYDEAIRQILVYTHLLKDSKTGLFFHAYDESGTSDWLEEDSNRSSEFWGRSIGWTAMTLVEVLDILPADYPQRDKLTDLLNDLVKTLVKYQDPKTGMWYQVINKPDDPQNWLETSCTAMFSYSMAKAVHKGFIDKLYLKYALKSYKGVASHKIYIDDEGLYTVKDICHGTVVGDYDYYLNRPATENNLRGLPAVILVAEELRAHPAKIAKATKEDLKRRKINKESARTSIYNVLDYDVKPDGRTLNTHNIQRIIELAHKSRGGTIYFPAGRYLTGTLTMRNNVYLELSPGATIYGSKDIRDYPDHKRGKALIYANGAKNFGIFGNGTINGNGDFFWRGRERPYNRPDRFMLFVECQNIRLNDITMLNSPSWNLELLFCDFAWIDGVTMISDIDSPNSDGIDPTSSSHVFISNCYFELGDDAICPKSRGTKPTEFMVVENCIIRSDDSAIKLGTRSEAPIRNLVFNNIIIKDTQYGIAFYAKDGGIFENIRFSNITIESVRNENFKTDRPSGSYPLFLDIERRKPGGPITFINDIHFSDITINSRDGHCLFLGQPDQKIENIYLSNITFNLATHRTFEGSKKPRGVRSLKNRAANDYSHIPSNFTFAYIKNLRIDNLDIRDTDNSGQYERHMIWGYDVHNVRLKGFSNTLTTPNKKLAQMCFKDATGIEITASSPTPTKTPFLFLEGAKTRDVVLMNNNFRKIKKIVGTDKSFKKSEVSEFNNLKK